MTWKRNGTSRRAQRGSSNEVGRKHVDNGFYDASLTIGLHGNCICEDGGCLVISHVFMN